ncbi:N-6 DNA methylase, partial [Escherichia coli]|nr:N-6 DNA methylase [Escherichia coli]
MQWKIEDDVDQFVQRELEKLGLRKYNDFGAKTSMSDYLKAALAGGSKTAKKTGVGIPDFHCEKYRIPVVIENKLRLKMLVNENKDGIRMDSKSVGQYAVNGAIFYAQSMIDSGRYSEVVAVGVAGDNSDNAEIRVYLVFGSHDEGIKYLESVKCFDFMSNNTAFDSFYEKAKLTEQERHKILIDSKDKLSKYASRLNKLMHNHNITAPQRVLYVSGMLLAMQEIRGKNGEVLIKGLTPDDLFGHPSDRLRDGAEIFRQIEAFLEYKNIEAGKRKLMLSSFAEIKKDTDRDVKSPLDKEVSRFINGEASTNKQIFTFIWEYIYKAIDSFEGHIDIVGELYSEFLKYALGDGKEIGIVLTPPYVTKMMAEILNINQDSRVMDLATGSAGFLISAMEIMTADAELHGAVGSKATEEKIRAIKNEQLLGVELNAEMYTLAATNMILRGDGSSKIHKANTFNTPPELYKDFAADRLLLNPPFSFEENGMPFIRFGLDNMQKGGLGAIIIQDSAGSGKAVKTNREILKRHTLKASIKMPGDLFQPMAGVQTSIYIFEAGIPHDFEQSVKFIDFRNDGYKRTSRSLQEVDMPAERYRDVVKIYKAGKCADVLAAWQLEDVYVEDKIGDSGADWNCEQHKVIDIHPTLEDFKKTVADYLSWEVSQILHKGELRKKSLSPRLIALEKSFKESGGRFDFIRAGDFFVVKSNPQLDKKYFIFSDGAGYPYFTRTVLNNGISGYVEYLDEEHKVEGGCLAVGMLGMQFFYMEKDFYAGQFTKSAFPKFSGFNKRVAQYFIAVLNKFRPVFQSMLIRDFENTFNEIKLRIPVRNHNPDWDFMERYIAELEVERIEELEAEHIEELEAYLRVTGLHDYKLDINDE